MEPNELQLKPIGVFNTAARYPYDVPRQGAVAGDNVGVIRLYPEYTEGLADLDGFSHLWVIYWFHQNAGWHLKVRPPRHVERKVGVFASRSPYRPNPIGMSAVRLQRIEKSEIWITGHDLLDGTPILDVKPYLPYADSFPDASLGWTGEDDGHEYVVEFSEDAERQLAWLESQGVSCLRQFALTQLGYEPLDATRHRLLTLPTGELALAYRTWRISFEVNDMHVLVTNLSSGYTETDLAIEEDKYHDKAIHRAFNSQRL